VSAVAFTHDGSLLASASWVRTVSLWDPSTGQEVQKFERHADGVNAVAFSHDGSLLASASWDRNLVSDTTGTAVSKPHEALGGLVRNNGKKGQGKEVEEQDEDEDEQLRLRLDHNLDIEVQLNTRINGDLTLGLLYGLTFRCKQTER
jgi:WD domain, G-beta repeat